MQSLHTPNSSVQGPGTTTIKSINEYTPSDRELQPKLLLLLLLLLLSHFLPQAQV
jgi:hypothetical protein